jgi:hypothetical protein
MRAHMAAGYYPAHALTPNHHEPQRTAPMRRAQDLSSSRSSELTCRAPKLRAGFNEEVENLLGFFAWHDLIDGRNEVQTRLTTEFGGYALTQADSCQNSLRVPRRERACRLVQCAFNGL